MTAPYALISDLHAHNWSAFASTNPDGVNNRLRHVLDELERAGEALLKAGGNHMVIAGDIFHQRGSIHPSVFNPTFAAFERLNERGIFISAIPGNHDLATKDTTVLGNAFQTLENLSLFSVYTQFGVVRQSSDIALLPWHANLDDLRKAVEEIQDAYDVSQMDLVIHAGINGVLTGMPDHALDAAEVAAWGFRRVFAGHYHHHKEMEGGKVYSIGATTHQTWGDIGTKAGFLLVYPDKVVYQASHAPNFVEINEKTDPAEIPLLVDGHYARIRGLKITDTEVKQLRTELESYGCRGLTFQVVREAVTARSGTPTKGLTIEESIDNFIDGAGMAHAAQVKTICQDIMTGVRALAT